MEVFKELFNVQEQVTYFNWRPKPGSPERHSDEPQRKRLQTMFQTSSQEISSGFLENHLIINA